MKVLIQCGDHLENQQRIGLLVDSLINLGYRPVVLMYGSTAGRLLLNKGAEIVFLDKYSVKETKKSLPPKLDQVIVPGVSYARALEVEIRRRPDIAWPGKIKNTLRVVRRTASALKKILEKYQPVHCVIWNGYTGYVANLLREICGSQGISTSFIERGILKGSLFIDRVGVNGASSLTELGPEFYDERLVSSDSIELVRNIFKVEERGGGLRPKPASKRRVFFPLQVQRDTNIILYSKYWSMRQAFLEIKENIADDSTEFILRPHPEESPDTRLNIPLSVDTSISNTKDLSEQLDEADLVVTINSTVGLEALLRGVPVISLGSSIYSSAGITAELDLAGRGRGLSVNYPRLYSYLDYFIKNNLLFPNGDNNLEVVLSQTGLSKGRITTKFRPLEDNIKSLVCEEVVVFIGFNFAEKLNLTYRKVKESITREWILSLLRKYVQSDRVVFLEFHEGIIPPKHKTSVLVLSEDANWKDRYRGFSLVIDFYGNLICNE